MSFNRPNIKIITLALIGLVLIALGYYNNMWEAVNPTFYTDWQAIFEPPVIGRLARSAQAGIFSDGALLGLGDFEVFASENAETYIWRAPSRVIEHQYDAYLNGKAFQNYTRYNSTSGAQGIVLGAFARFGGLPPNVDLKLFRAAEATLSALTLLGLFIWFAGEFGLLSMTLTILFAAFSIMLTLLGGNLYWNLWAFFLPLITLLTLLKRGGYPTRTIAILLFVTGLTKVLFNGFEFVTTAWIMYTVPLVYYAVLDKWTWKDFLKRELSVMGILAIVTIAGLLILATQIASVEGGYSPAVSSILSALNRRSIGDPTEFSGVFQEALRSDLFSVLQTYIHMPTLFGRDIPISSALLNSIVQLEIWVWITLFTIASVILLKIAGWEYSLRQKALALVAATWYSILAPLSWLVIFKAHAYIHTRLAPVVWQLPFLFFGIALIGMTVSTLLGRGQARMIAER